MKKRNRILMAVISTLLALTLLSSCLVSSTLAKFVKKNEVTTSVGVKQWGLTITPGSDLAANYSVSSNGTVTVKATTSGDKVIAPGTRGALAYFEVSGSTDVAYNVDFNGDISIGEGYFKTKGLLIDEKGEAIDYFPIAIYICRYDLNENGTLKKTEKQVYHCIVRLTPDAPDGMTLQKPTDETEGWDTKYRMSYFSGNRWYDLTRMEDVLNDKDSKQSAKSLDKALDSSNNTKGKVKSVYVVEWLWPYDSGATFKEKKEDYAKKTNNGNVYTYQTTALDSQISDAIMNINSNSDTTDDGLFDIGLTVSITLTQAPKTRT